MHPDEIWWLVDAKRPPRMYGSLSEYAVDELVEFVEAQGYQVERRA